ncbi:MAG TPA: hypothetical protein VFI32_00625 [Rhodanobacteraceae bacterium]|nr:hypothetical protein [Rhodanobacteraceae bacterium]
MEKSGRQIARLNFGGASDSLQMLCHRTRAGSCICGRVGIRPSVVQDFTHVANLSRQNAFAAAQDQVMILVPFESGAQPTCFTRQRGTNYGKVTHVISPAQKIGVPVRLEIGIAAGAVCIKSVFIRIQDRNVRLGRHTFGHAQQAMRTQLAILVEQRDEFAARRGQCIGARIRCLPVRLMPTDLDPRITN